MCSKNDNKSVNNLKIDTEKLSAFGCVYLFVLQ